MKKLIPILLALALAITSIIAFGTMFTGAEDPVTTMTFVPENLGTSVDNGQFKLGYFNSKKSSTSTAEINYWGQYYYDTVSDNKYSMADADLSYINTINVESAVKFNFNLHIAESAPFIEFTAPAAGTYTFNMTLISGWGSTAGNVDLVPCTVDVSTGTRTVIGSAIDFPATNQTAARTFEATLEKGESIILLVDASAAQYVEDHPFAISDISATLDLSTATDEYTAVISTATTELKKNETLDVDVVIGNKAFNSSEIVVKFDNTKLSFDPDAYTGDGEVGLNGDTVTIQNFGASHAAGDKFTLTFTAIEKTDATTIELVSAKASTAYQAEVGDLTAALVAAKTVTVKINPAEYDVSLDGTKFKGATTATEGTDYTFYVSEEDGEFYNYETPVAKIGDTTLSLTGDAENGWTIAGNDITGPITITGERTAKTFTLTFTKIADGDFGAKDVTETVTITYGQAYSFTLNDDADPDYENLVDGYTYALESIVYANLKDGEGEEATAKNVPYDQVERVITIVGSNIIDNMTVTIKKTDVAIDEVNVNFVQTYDEVTADAKASLNSDYTFTIAPVEGYVYTVSYKIGEETVEFTTLTGTDHSYTIPQAEITDHIYIKVEKALSATVTDANITEYVQLNGATVYIVYVDTDKLSAGNYMITYGENEAAPMYYVNNYNGYAFLVVVTGNAPTADQFSLAIDSTRGQLVIEAGYDVNMSEKVDVNDAQLVYNIYNAVNDAEGGYADFSDRVTMEKFLRADVNGTDKKVTTADTEAIVNQLFS